MKPSPRQRLASVLLDQPVADFIAERRAKRESFASIALALREATDGEIEITDEAVRQWHLAAQGSSAGAGSAA